MRAKVILPQFRSIEKVTPLFSRFLITKKSGRQVSLRFEDLTPKQETKLRAMVAPTKQRREVKPTRETGKPKKSINYAEQALGHSVFVNIGGEFAGIVEAR